MFFRKKEPSGPPEFLIAGLGNPGRQYENTRHNTGFICLDLVAEKLGVEIKKIQFKGTTARAQIGSHSCLLLKPGTFMNSSGESIAPAAAFYKIPVEKIIVIYDDITLDVGKMRIRPKGSDGGHNGMKSIIYHLSSDAFARIRIGVGAKPRPDYDLVEWVLSSFSKQDAEKIEATADAVLDSIKLITDGNIAEAMNRYNNR
ncbi:MAG: aminoacyl-tRNA hydrolase [Clostridiales bacterium]|nr:aminoacyl-tRNA hydrolase [Clostridiales bacterium]